MKNQWVFFFIRFMYSKHKIIYIDFLVLHDAICNWSLFVKIIVKSTHYWPKFFLSMLTHWSRVTHICVDKLTIISSDNGLSSGRRHAIIWTNAAILLIGSLGTNFSEISIEIHTFSFKKMHLKMLSAKWHLFCLGLNVLSHTLLYMSLATMLKWAISVSRVYGIKGPVKNTYGLL